MRVRPTAIVSLVLLASYARAAAEPAPSPAPVRLNLLEPARICTLVEPVRCRDLAPGVYVQADRWDALDTELKRAQDAETQLTAENESLRKSADVWHPGWKSLAVMLALGLAGGAYAGWRLSE